MQTTRNVSRVRQRRLVSSASQVLPVWQKAIKNRDVFAVKIARAAPKLLATAKRQDEAKIFDLLGRTLKLDGVSSSDREIAADAMLRAVLRGDQGKRGRARKIIRKYRKDLQAFPEIWRYIGAFA